MTKYQKEQPPNRLSYGEPYMEELCGTVVSNGMSEEAWEHIVRPRLEGGALPHESHRTKSSYPR